MKNILTQIIADKRKEVDLLKALNSTDTLEDSRYFSRQCISMKDALLKNDVAIIAEIKRASPSAGLINEATNINEIITSYGEAGAAGLSILTDERYFKGHTRDIESHRHIHDKPVLRKDFIIDEYQILEAKSIGADCILLIAAALTPDTLKQLAAFAKSLGLDVLLEVNNKSEVAPYISADIDIIGVNNRDLRNFEISIQNSIDLYEDIPDEFCKISESGIDSAEKIIQLIKIGFDGFLIGGYLMGNDNPGETLANLIASSKRQVSC